MRRVGAAVFTGLCAQSLYDVDLCAIEVIDLKFDGIGFRVKRIGQGCRRAERVRVVGHLMRTGYADRFIRSGDVTFRPDST